MDGNENSGTDRGLAVMASKHNHGFDVFGS